MKKKVKKGEVGKCQQHTHTHTHTRPIHPQGVCGHYAGKQILLHHTVNDACVCVCVCVLESL